MLSHLAGGVYRFRIQQPEVNEARQSDQKKQVEGDMDNKTEFLWSVVSNAKERVVVTPATFIPSGQGNHSELANNILDAVALNNSSIRQGDAFGLTESCDDIAGKKVVQRRVSWRMVFDLDKRQFCFVQRGERLTEEVRVDSVDSRKSAIVDYAFVAEGAARTRSNAGEWIDRRVKHESAALSSFLIPDVRSVGIETMPMYWTRAYSNDEHAKFILSKLVFLNAGTSGNITSLDTKVIVPSNGLIDVRAKWEIDNVSSMPQSKKVFYEKVENGRVERQPSANETFTFKYVKDLYLPVFIHVDQLGTYLDSDQSRDIKDVTIFERSTDFQIYWRSVNDPSKLPFDKMRSVNSFDEIVELTDVKEIGFESLKAAIDSMDEASQTR